MKEKCKILIVYAEVDGSYSFQIYKKKNPGISSLWVMISNYMDTLTCYAGNENLTIHFLYSDRGLAEADKVKVSKYPVIVLIR